MRRSPAPVSLRQMRDRLGWPDAPERHRLWLPDGQSQVRLQILREGLTLAAGGLAFGLLGAYALGRAMQSTLYGTGALSLPVLLVVSLVLLGAALIACYVPARRASAVDPMTALRQE